MKTEIERLRDTNSILFEQLRELRRSVDIQRQRAEKAETRLAEIERLTAHIAMERAAHSSHERGDIDG